MSEEKNVTILIVDDTDLNLKLLDKIIVNFTEYKTICTTTGQEAIEICNEKQPDLILLDVMMPKMDGYQVANEIKNNPATKDIPIIFITALSDEESKIKAFKSGGIDYLTKPFSKKEVISRITAQIKLKQQFEEIKRLNKVMMHELAIAKRIQKSIMPYKIIEFENLKIHCKYLPLEEIGGDYFDVIKISENNYLVFLTDITGHGIPASLYTMMMKANLYYLSQTFDSPGQIMSQLNKDLSQSLLDDFYPTAVILKLDLENMVLTYANAAHPSPLYFSSEEKQIHKLGKKHFSLGLKPNVDIVEHTLDIKPGDRLFLYTDGILEVKAQEDVEISQDTLLKLLQDSYTLKLDDQLTYALNNIQRKTEDNKFNDDVTIMGISLE